MRVIIGLIFWVMSASASWGYTPSEDARDIALSIEQCEHLKELVLKKRYEVDCGELYQQYNVPAANSYRPAKREIKIGSFNLYYPGSYKTAFKDFSLMAALMNRWDVIGVQELLGVVGQDAKHNEDVLKFLNNGDNLAASYEEKIESSSGEERAAWEEKLAQLKEDIIRAPSLYRAPGFVRLLEELRQLDSSWSLILTPRAEAAGSGHVHELSGFFYRASQVKARRNPHCAREYSGSIQRKFACLPNLRESFMGRDVGQIFSRRPFLASFQSGDFTFNLFTSHIVFTSPSDPEKMANILLPSFGVSDYRELGKGATKAKYARFAELKIILEFMQKYRNTYKESRVVYLGDTNINSDNPFWPRVLDSYPGSKVWIDEKTTLTQRRYRNNGEETYGLASNYDHFIFNPQHIPECLDEKGVPRTAVFNYLEAPFSQKIISRYLIRDDKNERLAKDDEELEDDIVVGIDFDYDASSSYIFRRERLLASYEQELRGIETIKDNQIVWDNYRFEDLLEVFERRMFTEQLYDRTYYRFIIEAMSDHLPISLDCKIGN